MNPVCAREMGPQSWWAQPGHSSGVALPTLQERAPPVVSGPFWTISEGHVGLRGYQEPKPQNRDTVAELGMNGRWWDRAQGSGLKLSTNEAHLYE